MQVMRLFVAAEVPEDIRDVLVALQDDLRPFVGNSVRWERPENFHVTLKFLGDVPVARIQAVFEAVRDAAATARAGLLDPVGLSAFPRPQRPRVLVMSFADRDGEVAQAAKDLEDRFARLGYPRDERPFHPHVTLGRARREARLPDLTEHFRTADLAGLSDFMVDQLVVFQSELGRAGASYTELARENLPLLDDP